MYAIINKYVISVTTNVVFQETLMSSFEFCMSDKLTSGATFTNIV